MTNVSSGRRARKCHGSTNPNPFLSQGSADQADQGTSYVSLIPKVLVSRGTLTPIQLVVDSVCLSASSSDLNFSILTKFRFLTSNLTVLSLSISLSSYQFCILDRVYNDINFDSCYTTGDFKLTPSLLTMIGPRASSLIASPSPTSSA